MQKSIKKYVLIILVVMMVLFIQHQMFNESIVYAESINVGQTWEYYYKESSLSYKDQEFVAPVTGVYEIKVYGEANANIDLRVKDTDNPNVLVTSYQIQGGNGGMACGYLLLNAGEKFFVHIMKGNSAGQIEQTMRQLQDSDLRFGQYCFISKSGTVYDEDARIYTIEQSLLKAEGGGYHCTDYEHGYSIDGKGEINAELCPEITYNGIVYSPKTQNGGGTGKASCIVTLKATEDNSIAYTVNHWQQKLKGDANQHDSTNYTLKETENLVATIGESISPTTKTYSGFTSPEVQMITIDPNGTTEINYYYTRNKYQYKLGECEGVITTGSTTSGSYYYESTIVLKAKVKEGYLWSKWSNNDSKLETSFNMPANDFSIAPIATKKEEITTEEPTLKPPQRETTMPNSSPEGDTTIATGVLPQTGIKMEVILSISIVCILVFSVFFYRQYRKLKDID